MKRIKASVLVCLFAAALLVSAAAPKAQSLDPNPPEEVVKLVFIHHSTGENWLTDGYGNLGKELGENNYFVSDTNYGWGPDSIGDRTDIPNWLEWFASDATPAYMEALFNENGQHSGYTRSLVDPGGENRIIMFKSCFPNSELSGSPDDPPGDFGDLSVSGAKFVYNQLLAYFSTRPDRLFIVITAPPVSASTYAENARAFNQWLVNDWLEEAGYAQGNVAVFDFYNVLTGSNAHHRYQDGVIEHILGSRDTLAYPSGDDHPSEKGSRKATEEFIPLLNIFYHNWVQNAPASAPVESTAADEEDGADESQADEDQSAAEAPASSAPSSSSAVIDDFEGGNPAGTGGWQVYRDEATPTTLTCATEAGTAYSGANSLMLDFDIQPNAWATCNLFYDSAQDWSGSAGLTFYLHAAQPGLIFNVDLYAGSPDAQETYAYTIETPAESAEGWVPVALYWGDFHRVDWEEDAGEAFAKPGQILGLAFGMNTYADTPNTGIIWVDGLGLMNGAGAVAEAPAQQADADSAESEDEPSGRRALPCGAGFLLPAVLIVFGLGRNHRKEIRD